MVKVLKDRIPRLRGPGVRSRRGCEGRGAKYLKELRKLIDGSKPVLDLVPIQRENGW